MSVIETDIMVNPLDDLNSFKTPGKKSRMAGICDYPIEENNLLKNTAELKNYILKTAENDNTRVELIKKELASRQYKIDCYEIAKKIFPPQK